MANAGSQILLGSAILEWTTSFSYIADDYVTGPDGNLYKCLVNHTSGTFMDDYESGDWVEISKSSFHANWATNTHYIKNKLVQEAGVTYTCEVTHTSTANFNNDLLAGNWSEVSGSGGGIPYWVSGADYSVDELVFFGDNTGGLGLENKFYRCLVDHTSGAFDTDLTNNLWVEVSEAGIEAEPAGLSLENAFPKWHDDTGTKIATQSDMFHDPVNNSIGIGTTTTRSFAKVQIDSIASGLLPPRMTTAQRDAGMPTLGTADAGLQIYNTTTDKIEFWNGTDWEPAGLSEGLTNLGVVQADPYVAPVAPGGGYDAGHFYVVNGYGILGVPFSPDVTDVGTGDWVVYDGANWDRIAFSEDPTLDNIPEWQPVFAYSGDNQVVGPDGNIYRLLNAHTSGADFMVDYQNGRWQEISDSSVVRSWATGTYYPLNKLILEGGRTYICITDHISTTFAADLAGNSWREFSRDTTYWAVGTSYLADDLVVSAENRFYRCLVDHTSSTDFDLDVLNDNWVEVSPAGVRHWETSIDYVIDDIVVDENNRLYNCITAHRSNVFSTDIANWEELSPDQPEWVTGTNYYVGNYVLNEDDLFRCTTSHLSGTSFSANSADWELISVTKEWLTGRNYEAGAWVYHNREYYRCLGAHTASNFFNEQAFWERISYLADWGTGLSYIEGTVATVSDIPVRVETSHSSTTELIGAPNWEVLGQGLPWRSGFTYYSDMIVSEGGALYRCTTAHLSRTTINDDIGNWQLLGGSSLSEWAAGENYLANNLVVHSLEVYRCLTNHLSADFNAEQANWERLSDLQPWSTGVEFQIGVEVHYENEMFRCVTQHTSTTFAADIANWERISGLRPWSTSTEYIEGGVVEINKVPVRASSTHTSSDVLTDSANLEVLGQGLPWVTGQTYIVNMVVTFDEKLYRCSTAHVASADFYTDTANWVQLSSAGGISPWSTGESYRVDNLVVYEKEIYRCTNNHTATTFTNDVANWDRESDLQPWETGVNYQSGVEVHYENEVFRCLTAHDSTTLAADITNWERMSGLRSWATTTEYIEGGVAEINRIPVRSSTTHISTTVLADAANLEVLGQGLPWITGQTYLADMMVSIGGSLYRCTTAHVATADFYADIANWEQLSGGGISDWGVGQDYRADDMVFYEREVYRCNTDHTSFAFTADIANWDRQSDLQEWETGVNYQVGVEVHYEKEVFRCTTVHDSTTLEADLANWERISGLEDWANGKAYVQGALSTTDGVTLRAVANHTSGADLVADESQWEVMGQLQDWVTGTPYLAGVVVRHNNVVYKCLVAHESSAQFFDDYNPGTYLPAPRWEALTGVSEFEDANFTASRVNQNYVIDTSGGAVTVTLPANLIDGHNFGIFLLNDDNAVTINAAPNTIGGLVNLVIRGAEKQYNFMFDNLSSNWEVSKPEILSWYDGVLYRENELIYHNDTFYRCLTTHTSTSSFSDDLDNGFWVATTANLASATEEIQNDVTNLALTTIALDGAVNDTVELQCVIRRRSTGEAVDRTSRFTLSLNFNGTDWVLYQADKSIMSGLPDGVVWSVTPGAVAQVRYTSDNMPGTYDTTASTITYWDAWRNAPVGVGGVPSPGGGDVTGPLSSVDDSLASFSGTTGKVIKDSGFSAANLIDRNLPSIEADLDYQGNSGIDIYSLVLTTTGTPPHSEGSLFYNESSNALAYYNDSSDMLVDIGQEVILKVRNNTGATIVNGQVVRITGSVGNRPTVALAQANNEDNANIAGVVTETSIPNNSDGYITSFGSVRDFDTSMFTEGDIVYLSDTVAGGITSIPPALKSKVGVITNAHNINGVLMTAPISNISAPTAAGDVTGPAFANDSHLAIYDGTTGKIIQNSAIHVNNVGDVKGPLSSTDENIAIFDGTTGKLIKNSAININDIGTGDVEGPAASVNENLAVFDGVTGKLIKDSALNLSDVGTGDVDGPASSTNENLAVFDGATGKLIKDSAFNLSNVGTGDVDGPASSTDENIVVFNGTTGKIVKDSAFSIADLNTGGDVVGPAGSTDSNLAAFDGATGKLIKDAAIAANVIPEISAEDTLTGKMKLAVVDALPGTPDADTIYFIKV